MKLGEIGEFSKRKNISKNDISETGPPCIRYGELYTHHNEKISKIFSNTNLKKENLVFSEKNDFIIPTSGETAIDIATASCILEKDVAIGGDNKIVKTSESELFLSYYFNSKRKRIAKLAQGVSVVHLYASHLKSLNLKLPSKDEQKKIANFLSLIDKKIELLEKFFALYESLTKIIKKNIFNQKYEFEDLGQHNIWKKVILGEIIEYSSSNSSINQLEENYGKYPLFEAQGFIKHINFYEKDESYIGIVKDGVGVGRIFILPEKSSVLGTLNYLFLKDSIKNNLKFVYYWISTINFKKYIVGSTIPHIYFKDYSKIEIKIPNKKEQTKIAKFLSNTDSKINLMELEIKNFEMMKNYLLQKMFI